MSFFARIITILCLCLLTQFNVSTVNAAPPSGFQTQQILNQGIADPSGLKIAPDGRIFILERTGQVKIFYNNQLTDFLTLPSAASGDRGLIGIAFDPDFLINNYIYFYYTALPNSQNKYFNYLVRVQANNNIASSPLRIFDTEYTNTSSEELHVGGGLIFGPDQKIYLGIGDNGYSANAQNLSNPFGKILRLNKDGSTPSDNPLVNQPNTDQRIYAYGFRNPWRLTYDPVTQNIFAGDVGDYSHEEINQILPSRNYGWPLAEGYCQTNCESFQNPLYSYSHNDQSSAITLGPVYRGSNFPSSYQGNIIFGDYARGFIQSFSQDTNTATMFDAGAGSVVDFDIAPDGSLYYLTYIPARIYKVIYSPQNQIPTASIQASITKGQNPLTVQFTSNGTYDPDSQPLTYIWDFGDGTSSADVNPAKTYFNNGTFIASLTVNDGTNTNTSNPIVIQVGIPPTLTIAAPDNNSSFIAGDTIFYSASAIDGAGFDLSDRNFTTQVIFHHDTHSHPFLGPLEGNKSGQFQIPLNGEPDPDVWYEIIVSVTDTNGLADTKSVRINPHLTNYQITTSPPGLNFYLNGIPHSSSFSSLGLINYHHLLDAPQYQIYNDQIYQFSHWNSFESKQHTFILEENNNQPIVYFEMVSPFATTYFSDTNLNNQIITTTTTSLDKTWGYDSPHPQVPPDNFSARFTSNQFFQAGTYQFTLTADDGVRLYINDQLLIDKWQDQPPTTYQATYSFNQSGEFPVKVEYYEKYFLAQLNLSWQLTSQAISPPPTPTPTPTPEPTPPDQFPTDSWLEQYWNYEGWGQVNIPNSPPQYIFNSPPSNINYQWSPSPNSAINEDFFVAKYTRKFNLPPNSYRLTLTADDGVRVYINNQIVIDVWQNQPPTTFTKDLELNAQTLIEIHYFERTGGASFNFDLTPINNQPTPTPTITPPADDLYYFELWNLPPSYSIPSFPNSSPDAQFTQTDLNQTWPLKPHQNINADFFLGRVTRNLNPSSPTSYQITLTADDGVRLYLNGQLLIDKWQDQPATTYQTTANLTSGNNLIVIEYYERAYDAVLITQIEPINANPTPTPPLDFWQIEYWNSTVRTFPNRSPDALETTQSINFTWGYDKPLPSINPDNFLIRANRTITLAPGNYQFKLNADDGVRLFIDGQLVIDAWQDQSPTTFTYEANLDANPHPVQIDYYENGYNAQLALNIISL